MKIFKLIIAILTLLISAQNHALFRGLAKTTDAVTEPVAKIVPPIRPIVKIPTKIFEGISITIEGADFKVTNNASTPLKVEIRKEKDDSVIQTRRLAAGRTLKFFDRPAIVVLSYPDSSAEPVRLMLKHNDLKGSVALTTTMDNNQINVIGG